MGAHCPKQDLDDQAVMMPSVAKQEQCHLAGLEGSHLDVEMLDQPLPTGQNGITEVTSEKEEEEEMAEDIEDLDHYEMKEEEPISGKVRE
ncbi:Ubiquitin-conjugating enzyme E2 Q2 [Sciurus carolinensis]|uniref:Ubiquitin-conjugating enzyme E2 Q2 n=1 Tax=Sciurus carolinensis TaxID=30640 RepID=A0AA41SV03_SCICA|nr:Ubiquitin-conjugating enzyme E2 Q2 [Sciurus carolinensis]